MVVLAPAVLRFAPILNYEREREKDGGRDERCGDPETRVMRINAAEYFFTNTLASIRCLIYIPEYRNRSSGGSCSLLDPSKILGDCP